MSLEIYTKDNFLEKRLQLKAIQYALNMEARWGEYDFDPNLPTGCTVNIREHEQIYHKFDQVSRDSFPCIKDYELVRVYCNVFMPGEEPQWHLDVSPIDGLEAYTVLYYPHLKWERNQGGCTEFWAEDHIFGSLPLPNRAVCFNGGIWHRARPMSNQVRFTYSLKYELITDPNLDLRMYGSARPGEPK